MTDDLNHSDRPMRFAHATMLSVIVAILMLVADSCGASPSTAHAGTRPIAAAAQHAGFRACKRCRPDASLATDMGVAKGAAALGLPTTPATLIACSQRWQPWRSYSVQYLWATHDHPINHWTVEEPPCARPA